MLLEEDRSHAKSRVSVSILDWFQLLHILRVYLLEMGNIQGLIVDICY